MPGGGSGQPSCEQWGCGTGPFSPEGFWDCLPGKRSSLCFWSSHELDFFLFNYFWLCWVSVAAQAFLCPGALTPLRQLLAAEPGL